MHFNTALFVIHEYEISKINLFKSSFLSSKINSVEKTDSIFLVDAVLGIIIVRCYMTFRSRTKGGCEYNYKDMPLFINNLIGAVLNSK